jgi:bacterioferritin
MKGNEVVIGLLEKACDNEARAIFQYRVDRSIFENMGIGKLAAKIKGVMEEEQEHFNRFLARLVFLEESPIIEIAGGSTVSPKPRLASPKEILNLDLQLEMAAVALYAEGCSACFGAQDFVSFELFKSIMEDEQEHVNYIESQFDLIAQIGEANYIQAYISEA